jgi:hypothetical protein
MSLLTTTKAVQLPCLGKGSQFEPNTDRHLLRTSQAYL